MQNLDCVSGMGPSPKGLNPLDLSPFLRGLKSSFNKGLKPGLGLKPFIDELQAFSSIFSS